MVGLVMELIGSSLVAISCLVPAAEGVSRYERIPGHVIMTQVEVRTQTGIVSVVGPMCFSGDISNMRRVKYTDLIRDNQEAVREVQNR